MKHWKSAFSILGLTIGLLVCLQSFAPAKIERSRLIKKDFDAKAAVVAKHEYGPLTIKKSGDGRIHLEAEMLLTGSDEESIQDVLNRFDVEAVESATELRLTTDLGIENCNTINNNMTVKYKDGHKVKGIHEMTVKLTLFVPNPEKLTLENKYERIELADDYNGALRVSLYSGDLLAANLGGSLDLDLKYGKAKLGNIGKATLEVFDSEVRTGTLQQAVVSSKYSEFVVGDVAGYLTLQTYDEHWQAGSVGGRLTLDDKYSDFRFANVGGGSLVLFDGEFTAEAVGDLEIKDSKYSAYKIKTVGSLKLGNVFDDEYLVQVAGHIEAKNSKYTEYRIGKLGKQFSLGLSYDDTVELEQVAVDFSYIGFDGKYTDMAVTIAEGARFQLDVDIKYGKVTYPENRVETLKHVEKDDQTVMQANAGPPQSGGQFNSLKIRGFDNTLVWKD